MIDDVPPDLAELERRLGHRFADPERLIRALTHASYANEHPPLSSHEALALVGDAALGLVVAEHVFGADPAAPVGVLTPRRAEVVSGANLARWAADLDLGPLIRLGRGEDQTGGRTRESILATTLEALLGAIYLEAGIPAVRRVVAALAKWASEGGSRPLFERGGYAPSDSPADARRSPGARASLPPPEN